VIGAGFVRRDAPRNGGLQANIVDWHGPVGGQFLLCSARGHTVVAHGCTTRRIEPIRPFDERRSRSVAGGGGKPLDPQLRCELGLRTAVEVFQSVRTARLDPSRPRILRRLHFGDRSRLRWAVVSRQRQSDCATACCHPKKNLDAMLEEACFPAAACIPRAPYVFRGRWVARSPNGPFELRLNLDRLPHYSVTVGTSET
jgi:hypothetical protein